MKDPWGLTPRETEVMTLLIQTGLEKVVAIDLGISHKTVAELVNRARRRMGTRTRMLAVLEYDRWARSV